MQLNFFYLEIFLVDIIYFKGLNKNPLFNLKRVCVY